MNAEDLEALVSYRLQRAEVSLEAAALMRDKAMLGFAMNRIYYAMFYAVQAALISKGVSFSKHGQVKGYLNRELIKTGILPVSLGKTYNKAFEYRQKYDYVDFADPDAELVESYLHQAKGFVDTIKKFLGK